MKDCKGLPLPERLGAISNLAAFVKPYLAALHSVFICCRAQDPEIAFVTNARSLHACFLKECNLMAWCHKCGDHELRCGQAFEREAVVLKRT